MAGFIYDFRQELESNIWLMPPMYHRVWQWIKYSVNHSEAKIPNKDGTMTTIKPGQRATSYRQIAKGVGYYEGLHWKEPNAKTIKAILDWMVKQEMISLKGNSQGTVITVANWGLYQKEKARGNTKETRKKHSLDTNNKELINEELMNKEIYSAQADNIRKVLPKEMTKNASSKPKLIKAIKEHGEEKLINSIKSYDKYVQGERQRGFKELRYCNEQTFWNGRYIDYLDNDKVLQDNDKKFKEPIVVYEEVEYE